MVLILGPKPASWPGMEILVFAILVLSFELASPRLPDWGYQSASVGWYIAISEYPELGSVAAAGFVVTALMLRTLLRRAREHR